MIMSRNLLEVYDLFLACLYIGVTVSFVHAKMGTFGLTHLLFTIKPKVIFCEALKVELLQTCLSKLYLDTNLIFFGAINHDADYDSDKTTDSEDSDYNAEKYKFRRYSHTDIKKIINSPKHVYDFFNIYKDTCTCCICEQYGRQNEIVDCQWSGRTIPFYTLMIDTEDIPPFELVKIEDPATFPAILSVGYGRGGLPKAIAISHTALVHQMIAFRSTFKVCDRVLQYTSMYRIIGVIVFLHAMNTGATRLYLPKLFHIQKVFNTIKEYKPNKLVLTPAEMWTMTKYQLRFHYNLCCVKEIILGPNIVSNKLKVITQQLFTKATITLWYGYPELGIVSMTDPQTITSHSVGKLLAGVSAKVVDLVTNEDTWRSETGELCFKMPIPIKGLYESFEADNQLIDENGWYHTGDVAFFDFCDCLYIKYTNLDKILQNGYAFSTFELETVLIGHNMIKTAAVVKIPHQEFGEIATAFIVKEQGINIKKIHIDTYITEKLALFKKLSGGIKFKKKIPKIRVGKHRVFDRETLRTIALESYKKEEEERTKRTQRAGEIYMRDRKIVPLFSFLAGHLFSDQPDDPIDYLCKLIRQCIEFRDKNGPIPYLYSHTHLKGLCFQMAGPHGGLSEEQYRLGMRTLNIRNYTLPLYRNEHKLYDYSEFIKQAQNLERFRLKQMLRAKNKIPKDKLLENDEPAGGCVVCH